MRLIMLASFPVMLLVLVKLFGLNDLSTEPLAPEVQAIYDDCAREESCWQQKAEQGDAVAQFIHGSLYMNGQGVRQNSKKALFWVHKAANQGYAPAQGTLGEWYSGLNNGSGVPVDQKKAAVWYRKAADQGLAISQFNVGQRYRSGAGVAQDYQQMVFWYRKAAAQGFAAAQIMLARAYRRGLGVRQNYLQAYKWFNILATQATGDYLALGRKERDQLAQKMTPEQIAKAISLSLEWKPERTAPAIPGKNASSEAGGDNIYQAVANARPRDDKTIAMGGVELQTKWRRDYTPGTSAVLMMADFTIKNKSDYTVNNIGIECKCYLVNEYRVPGVPTVYERPEWAQTRSRTIESWYPGAKNFPAHSTRVVPDFGMGIINPQIRKATCEITDLEIVAKVHDPERENIRAIQQLLGSAGYDVGVYDGILGGKTRAAIRKFQQEVGLPVNGKVSKELRQVLKSFLPE